MFSIAAKPRPENTPSKIAINGSACLRFHIRYATTGNALQSSSVTPVVNTLPARLANTCWLSGNLVQRFGSSEYAIRSAWVPIKPVKAADAISHFHLTGDLTMKSRNTTPHTAAKKNRYVVS